MALTAEKVKVKAALILSITIPPSPPSPYGRRFDVTMREPLALEIDSRFETSLSSKRHPVLTALSALEYLK